MLELEAGYDTIREDIADTEVVAKLERGSYVLQWIVFFVVSEDVEQSLNQIDFAPRQSIFIDAWLQPNMGAGRQLHGGPPAGYRPVSASATPMAWPRSSKCRCATLHLYHRHCMSFPCHKKSL